MIKIVAELHFLVAMESKHTRSYNRVAQQIRNANYFIQNSIHKADAKFGVREIK